jgi:predicted kinase
MTTTDKAKDDGLGKLKLTRGVPASGKTTWAKAWVAEDPERRARFNRDDYRAMMFDSDGVLTYAQEKAVSAAQQAAVKAALNAGLDVVVDDTNLRAKFVRMWYGIASEIEFVDFAIGIDEAYERDAARERSVGPDVLKMFFDKFIGKDGLSLPPVPLNEAELKFKPYSHTPGLPWAILVDVDGTLAHMGDRSPYDPTRYHEDTVDEVVRDLVNAHYATGERVIIFSARDDTYRASTYRWLAANDVAFDQLVMRPAGDTRNDAIVKDEMFEQHIAGKYNVRFVLDDRDRVINMWRAKGLKALQVADGNF